MSRAERYREPPAAKVQGARAVELPHRTFRYVVEASAIHQVLLLLLTVGVFLLEAAPLELQRRIVNDLTKHRQFRFFSMNFLMNLSTQLQVVAALLAGGWAVYTERLEIGGVVALISGIARLTDPWGDLVNYFRDVNVTQVKFRLLREAVTQQEQGQRLETADATRTLEKG